MKITTVRVGVSMTAPLLADFANVKPSYTFEAEVEDGESVESVQMALYQQSKLMCYYAALALGGDLGGLRKDLNDHLVNFLSRN